MARLLRQLSFGLSLALTAQSSPSWSREDQSRDLDGPTAAVKNGSVIGVHSKEYQQDFFLGIPYAQPPVGELRFKNPQSLNTTYAEPLCADRYSSNCVGYGDDAPLSEDCLYLNVIRPSDHSQQPLPVAVWIYGGGLRGGGTAGSAQKPPPGRVPQLMTAQTRTITSPSSWRTPSRLASRSLRYLSIIAYLAGDSSLPKR